MNPCTPGLTQACEDRDFVQWHQGCPWCAVWVVRVDVPAMQTLVHAARLHLAAALLPRYERQAHVTVAYRGLMAGTQAHAAAEFGSAELQRDIALLQNASVPPLAVQVQGAGSFTTVPYLAVQAGQPLLQLHEALSTQASYPGWTYVPHVTLGHYARQMSMEQVLAQLQACLGDDVLWRTVADAVWLARYRTHDIAGALSWEGRFDLRTRTYHAAPGALLSAS
ncbi:2'-5' RNA ligase family protein [Comamonas sp.]